MVYAGSLTIDEVTGAIIPVTGANSRLEVFYSNLSEPKDSCISVPLLASENTIEKS